MKSVEFDERARAPFDAVLIATDRGRFDYGKLARWSKLVVDTRNATKGVGNGRAKVVLA